MKIFQKIICAIALLGLLVWPGIASADTKADTKSELKSKLSLERQKETSLLGEQERYEHELAAAQKAREQVQSDRQMIQRFLKSARQQQKEVFQREQDLKTERNSLASDVYVLLGTDPDLYILAGSDDLPNMLQRNSYLKLVLEEKMNDVARIDSELKAASNAKKSLQEATKKKNAQLKTLKESEKRLTNSILESQKQLAESKDKQWALEKQLLNLETVGAKNERDFVFWNVAEGENFTIYGGGTEHGLGLSQYGAKGLAEEGLSANSILAHYYQGTTVETRETAGQTIRVKIAAYQTGKIYGRGGSFSVNNTNIDADGWVELSDGYFSAFSPGGQKVTEGGYDTLKLSPSENTTFEVEYKEAPDNKYHGAIEVVSGGPYTINVLGLEDYLKGVVPAEVNPSWPREAVKAQAIAARSYAATHLGGSLYDVDDTQQYQVYGGAAVEDWQSNEAVTATAGMMVTYQGDIITAYYFSTSGGWTENNELVWGGKPLPYLRGVSSMYETDSPFWSWQTKEYSRTELSEIFGKDERSNVGELKTIKIENRGVSGRVIKVTLIGADGEKMLTGADFREIFNQYSPADDPALVSTLFGVKAK